MKTAELKNELLDYWVIKALGYQLEEWKGGWRVRDTNGDVYGYVGNITPRPTLFRMSPSTDWSQGGPIIEREKISHRAPNDATRPDGSVVLHINNWYASIRTNNTTYIQTGPTALIAAMRCYVTFKFGEKVEIPNESSK